MAVTDEMGQSELRLANGDYVFNSPQCKSQNILRGYRF